jgi:hypothetical protein
LFEKPRNHMGVRVPYANSQVKMTTTEVLTAVARLESIPATPRFARIAVSAAKKADSSDQVNHVMESKYHARSRAAWFLDRVILCFSGEPLIHTRTFTPSRDRKGAEFH